jgi:NAD(P)-dependent dehydrogenase (short-subunit alcohol dehydrogenase family)
MEQSFAGQVAFVTGAGSGIGPTDTGMAARTPEPLRHSLSDGRVRPYASPEEIADIALFLAGAGAADLVGAMLLANGGRFTA